MDEETRKELVQDLNAGNGRLLLFLREEYGQAPQKIRISVWMDGGYYEVETFISDMERFEALFQDHVRDEVLKEAKDIIKNGLE